MVVKSLSGEQIDEDRVLYTSRVDGEVLDPSYAWFTQRAINKSADLTACYIDGNIFAFELPATSGAIDWRANLHLPEMQQWRPLILSAEKIERIHNFMRDCGLRYGRLDFVFDADQMFFLEVNPNGQWAWLDLDDNVGLITAMIDAIRGRGPGAKELLRRVLA